MSFYTAQRPVAVTARTASHLILWLYSLTEHHLHFRGKYSATLQLMRKYPPL